MLSASFMRNEMEKRRYKLNISYDGTHYCGWQIQPNGTTIQGLIERALATLLRREHRLIGAGRTDAGVHALGQVAHFDAEKQIDCDKLFDQLNGILPFDIRIKSIEPVSQEFHAQHLATSKEYHYHLWLERMVDPFHRLYRHHLKGHFSHSLLEEATAGFIGTHDFATFANVGTHVKSTVRTIFRISVVPQEGGLRMEFEGDGFLYKMVRNVVGTILEVAQSKIPSHKIQELFSLKNRQCAGIAAPARGLFLFKVNYPLRNDKNLLA
jgi:tRNA pseudouridine38-40 synthase